MSEMSILSGGNPSRVCLRLISDRGKPPRSPGRAKNSRLLKEQGGKREGERVGLPPIGQHLLPFKAPKHQQLLASAIKDDLLCLDFVFGLY